MIQAALRDAEDHGYREVLAGGSAALWWGLDWIGPPPDRVVVSGGVDSGRSSGDLLRRISPVPPDQITVHDGAHVASVGFAIVDSARLGGPRLGLVLADGALHQGLITPDALATQISRRPKHRGIRHARWVGDHADGRSESPGETISRFAMIQARVPQPELQHEFYLPGGRRARCDFHWRGTVHVGEFDGLLKYRAGSTGSSSAEEVVIAEKLREDELRSLGLVVTRWTWQDAWHPDALMRRLRTLLFA